MRAREAAPWPELQPLLDRLQGWHSVLEIVVVEVDATATAPERHHAAAVVTLEAIGRRIEARIKRGTGLAELPPGKYFQVAIAPGRARGRPISVAELVGPYFDWPSRRLILRGRQSEHLNDYFRAGDPETPAHLLERPEGEGPCVTQGLADAFADPPYGLDEQDPARLNEVFIGLADELFGGFAADLEVYGWSTNWSNYFDAGHAWWGAFLWTVREPRTGRMVGLAASATD